MLLYLVCNNFNTFLKWSQMKKENWKHELTRSLASAMYSILMQAIKASLYVGCDPSLISCILHYHYY